MAAERWVDVDRGRCIGSGTCAFTAPGVFDVGADGTAVVIGDVSAADERIALAVEGCPTGALAAGVAAGSD